jgi:type IV pilus assembly protein PilC
MPSYRYKAVDDLGHIFKGIAFGADENALENDLFQKGLFLIKSKVQKSNSALAGLSISHHIKPRLLVEFYHRFSQTLELGLPLLEGLEENARFLPSKALRTIAGELKMAVEGGRTLFEAMKRYPKVFSKFDLAIIQMGEQAGVLPNSLKKLATFLEWKEDIRSVIKKATIYPCFVILGIAAVIGVWIGYVLPKMVTVLSEMGIDLPDITIMVLNFSLFLQKYWLWLTGTFFLMLAVFFLYQKTRQGGYITHKVLLMVPAIGPIYHHIALTRLCHNFATMYSSGMALPLIFNVLANNALGNRYLEKRLRVAFELIEKGDSITSSFEKAGGFPGMMIGALKNGEKTGTLDDALSRLGDYYDGEVKRTVQVLVNAVEPVTILLLGTVFGIIILSILLPLYDVMGDFGKAY